MPRKPNIIKTTITVVLNGAPVTVTLHPPAGARKAWYAYWPGLVASRSTGQRIFKDAVVMAESMVKNHGQRAGVHDFSLTDEEFEQIQRAHFFRKTDPMSRHRAEQSLVVCLEAIRAFKTITGLDNVALASPDDCALFQRYALEKPKNWRQFINRKKKRDSVEKISPNTVLKWSRSLQAAFQRANKNAGRKCVRGVIAQNKLLAANPWNQFDWIEGRARPIRQLDANEITALLDYLETTWDGVPVAALLAKVFLWSACRQQEGTGLTWSSLRKVGDEVHFEIVGKWGVERWFRIPVRLFAELEMIRTESPFVFGAYNDQLRRFHERSAKPINAKRVGDVFKPKCLGDWFANQMENWSATLPSGHAHTHVLRKTTLQYARIGEDLNRQVAVDARLGESVMMKSYVKETDEQLRQASNRTYARIVASMPANLALRCGYVVVSESSLEDQLNQAIHVKDWPRANELISRLSRRQFQSTG